MMLDKIRRLLNRTIFKRLSDVEISQLIILKRSDESLRRMEAVMDSFEKRTVNIDIMLGKMEDKLDKFDERAINIERIGLELFDMISVKAPVSLDMIPDLDNVV